jgi:hypothetical protein
MPKLEGYRFGHLVVDAVAADSLARRQRLDLDAPLPEPLDRLRAGLHLRVRARAHDQVLGQLVNDVIEIDEDETVPVRAPPKRGSDPEPPWL